MSGNDHPQFKQMYIEAWFIGLLDLHMQAETIGRYYVLDLYIGRLN